jgi:hypothetical protein
MKCQFLFSQFLLAESGFAPAFSEDFSREEYVFLHRKMHEISAIRMPSFRPISGAAALPSWKNDLSGRQKGGREIPASSVSGPILFCALLDP